MVSYISAAEAAELMGCTVRKIQMLCKSGGISGAVKVSGVWLLPSDFHIGSAPRDESLGELRPESLYGRAAVSIASGGLSTQAHKKGCTVAEYRIIEGVTLVFQDIYEEKLDYGGEVPGFPESLIAIQHCREGRFEGRYPNGECIYMGPGSLSVNLPAWAPLSNSFPLRHYSGFYIALLPSQAREALKKLESVLGPLHIDFSALSEGLSQKNRLAFYSPDEKTRRLIDDIYPSQGEIRRQELKLKVLSLLQRLCAQEAAPPPAEQYFSGDQVRTVKEIRQYLISNLGRHITLRELAARFPISLTAMKTCFRGVYGSSIGKYIREYRMQAGAELLSSGNMKVIDIASALGYENASKFSEAFAAFYGVSPVEYRRRFCPSGAEKDSRE